MTTSLSKSTIPEYDPTNSYSSPRQVPRVKFEAQEIYHKHRGSLNIGDWSIQAQDWNSPRPQPKVKFEEAQQTYNKNKGSMKEILTGYCDNPAVPRKGPRVSKSAYDNFQKNRGTFSLILNHENNTEQAESKMPKVYFEGLDNREQGYGVVSNLYSEYGNHPIPEKPIPRVKFEGANNLINNRGSQIDKTLKMVPLTRRPSSGSFFDMRPN